MKEYLHSIATTLAECDGATDSEAAREKLRQAQAAILDARWHGMLDGLRSREPFRGLSQDEQKRALLRLTQLNRSLRQRGPTGVRPLSLPMPTCQPGWREIVSLGSNGFAFGSNDVPHVVPATILDHPNVSGNSIVEATFPAAGLIGVGAAVGTLSTMAWEPSDTLGTLYGNRASGSLSLTLRTPPLGQVAPGALMVSCGVQLQNPTLGMVSGDPAENSVVWVCGQATLFIFAGGGPHDRDGFKMASEKETLFAEAGTSQYWKNTTNIFGEPWATVVMGQTDLTQPVGLTATISLPPPDATYLYVNVAVEVSAWQTEDARFEIALVDSTGADTGLPILTAPNYFSSINFPYPTTAGGTGPARIFGLRACGI